MALGLSIGAALRACDWYRILIGERMEIAHHRLHPLAQHMSIDLRRRDIRMAEQLLQHPQIGSVLQEMAREGVAQHMRANPRGGDPRRGGASFEIAGKCLAG